MKRFILLFLLGVFLQHNLVIASSYDGTQSDEVAQESSAQKSNSCFKSCVKRTQISDQRMESVVWNSLLVGPFLLLGFDIVNSGLAIALNAVNSQTGSDLQAILGESNINSEWAGTTVKAMLITYISCCVLKLIVDAPWSIKHNNTLRGRFDNIKTTGTDGKTPQSKEVTCRGKGYQFFANHKLGLASSLLTAGQLTGPLGAYFLYDRTFDEPYRGLFDTKLANNRDTFSDLGQAVVFFFGMQVATTGYMYIIYQGLDPRMMEIARKSYKDAHPAPALDEEQQALTEI